jgi:opacity protein-like surface antigen
MQARNVLRCIAGLAAIAAATTTLWTSTASAQSPPASGRGFLFGAPSGSLALRIGYSGPNAGSDLFAFVTDELTLRKRDFGSFAMGGDLSFSVSSRFDVMLSVDTDAMEKTSEFREWIDDDGNPIEQSTAFSRQSYMVSAKYYVLPHGRSLGRFAWVPARYVPWVSAGAGRIAYTFSQNGDFIDFEQNNKVFHDSFKSSKWGNSAHVSAGVDWSLTHRFALTTQARYLFGKAELETDYSGFDPIDLSGLGLTAGLTIRF